MNNVPLISIVTITYNSERTIERTIKSVLNQTYNNYQYIVIDGGSRDETINILQKYKNSIFYLSEPDEGISDAFNKAITYCKGDYIGFINSDDWYEEDALNSIIPYCPHYDVIYGNLNIYSGAHFAFLQKAKHELLYKKMSLNHPASFIKSSLFNIVGKFDISLKLAMDYDLFLRLYLKNIKFKYINKALANYSLEGISDKKRLSADFEVFKIKNKQIGFSMNNIFYLFISSFKIFISLIISTFNKLK